MRVETTGQARGIRPFLGTGTRAQQGFCTVRKSLKNGNVPRPPCTIFAVFEVKMEILAQYLALPKSSLFGRTSPAEATVILIRNL